jgi:hypothetical protein
MQQKEVQLVALKSKYVRTEALSNNRVTNENSLKLSGHYWRKADQHHLLLVTRN